MMLIVGAVRRVLVKVTRVVALAMLALCLALALPAAIVAWLAGGHVTATQAEQHDLAMATIGEHQHTPRAHDHLLANARRLAFDGQPGLTTAGPAIMGTWLQAVAVSLVVLMLLAPMRRHRPVGAARPVCFCPEVALPPPR